MPSKIQVDQIAGATGSTVTLPSGQTLDLSSGTVNLPSASLSALNASNLTSGTVPSARLSLTSSDLPTVPTTKGGTGLTTIGTAEQVLRVNSGATALEFATASSDFVKLASTTTASASSVSFDGYFSSTYDNYVIYINGYGCANANSLPRVRFRRSNADVTASNYRFASGRFMRSSGTSDVAAGETAWDVTSIALTQDMSNAGVTAHNYIIQIPNPLSTAVYPSIIFDGTTTNGDNGDYYRRCGFGRLTSTGALSGISFFQDSGNMAGTFKLYGIKA